MRTMTYAGKPFADFSCYFDTSQVFRKPAKRVNAYGIPAHNGNYLISDKTYDNVTIMFNCYIKDNYEQNYSDIINFLNSFDTYQRLETSAEPNIYRMALLHASVEPDMGQFLKDGQFTIEFDCMPQEFLKTGDTEISGDGVYFNRTDNPLVLDNTSGSMIVQGVEGILEPTQNRSGAKPWAITGKTSVSVENTNGLTTDTYAVSFHTGKNLLNYPVWKTDGITGGSATWSNNGVKLTANSTDCYTNYQSSTFPSGARISVTQGDVLIMTWELSGTANGDAYIFGNAGTTSMAQTSASSRYLTYTVPSGITYVTFRVGVRGNGNSLTYSNIMIRKNNTEGSFEEYGTTGLSTIYGGKYVLNGNYIDVTMDVIEYYNGQTIGEPWLSSLDTYSAGATPTTGAKVVYTLPTPITYHFDQSFFTLLSGTNTLTTDASNVRARGTEPSEVVNPTYMDAQPILKFSGAAGFYINGQRFQASASAIYPLYVDCETMDAYAIVDGQKIDQNHKITLPDNLVKLTKGTNYLSATTADKVKVIPRWWRL